MGTFFFYNNKKPRKFNYQPILYNPEQEERDKNLQQRIRAMKQELDIAPEEDSRPEKVDFGKEFLNQTKHLKKRRDKEESETKNFFANNYILILILLALFAVFYFWILR